MLINESNKVYLLKGESTHIRPARKGLYNQALRKEEYESIPEILRIAKFAVIDIENENLQIVFADMVRSEYINKIIINKNKLENWIVTVGKVEKKYEFSEKKNKTLHEAQFDKRLESTKKQIEQIIQTLKPVIMLHLDLFKCILTMDILASISQMQKRQMNYQKQ